MKKIAIVTGCAKGIGKEITLELARDGYDIIGKTGTAEVINPNTGRYYPSSYRSIKSFEGMYPKNDPKFVFLTLHRSIILFKR